MERSKPEPDNVPNGASHGADEPTNADVSSREDHRWLRSVVEHSSEIVTIVDPDGTLRYASPAFGRVLGYDPEEAIGKMNVLDYVHLDDLPHVLEETEEALSKGGVATNKAEYRFRHWDGSWRWMESLGTYLLDDPHVGGVVVTSRDVTERKEAEEALRRSEAEVFGILESITDAFFSLDREWRFAYVNHQAEVLLNKNKEDLVGERIWEDQTFYPQYRRAVAEGSTARFEAYYPPLKKWFSVRAYPSDSGLSVYFQDVTEQKSIEEKLRCQARLLDAVGESVIALDKEGRILYWNRVAEGMYGWSSEEAMGRNLRELVVPESLRGRAEDIAAQLREGRKWTGELVVRRKDGTTFPVEGTDTPVFDEDGELVGVIGVLRDVTERKRAEEALKQSEDRLRVLLENSSDLISLVNPDNTFRYTSPSVKRMLGYEPEELVGTLVSDLVHPEDFDQFGRRIVEQIQNGTSPSPHTVEGRYRHKDGSWRRLETILNVRIDDPNVEGVVCASRDVTERKEVEEALRESEKRFRSLVQNASDVITVVDADGTISYVSPAIERMLGYRPQERMGRSGFELIHVDDLPRARSKFAEALRSPGETLALEVRMRDREGSWRDVELAGTNLLDDSSVGGIVINWRDITERVRAEERLRQAEARYRALVERMPAVVYIQEIGSPDAVAYMSPRIEALTGYTPEECKDPDLRWRMVHPDDRERMQAEDERTGEPGEVFATEYRVVHRDGRTIWVRNESVMVEEEGGGSRYWQGFMVDITERKQSEGLVRQQAALLEQTHDAVFMWKLGGGITYWNQGAERLYGWSKEEALGRTSHELLKTIHSFAPEELVRRLQRDGHWEGELVHHARDERRVVVESRHVLTHYDSEPGFVLETNRDITDHKALEERLQYQANHDLLTDLPNRQLFLDRLQQALRRNRRRPGSKAVVLFVDLDNFKVVNDSLGHEVGDLLLVRVGERLRRCLRPEDTLSRFGGDEFAMLLENVYSSEVAIRVAERIIEELRNPFMLEGRELVLRASVGIAMGHDRSTTPGELLKDADTAMYRAKEDGVGYRVFEPEMYEQALRRLKVENDMRRAIEAKEFVVNYQPLVDLKTGVVWGSEALVRWVHPERGLLDPSQFVPVAEETGLIVPLGERVLEEACRQAVEWQRGRLGGVPPVVCVNLSARQLGHRDLAETVERVLQSTGLDGRCLCLDITETLYITVLEGNTVVLDDLKRMGVRISVDDFGMGYSSLSYLKRLPADTLKIDKSFVAGLGEDVQDTAIVQMVINLAHSLGMGAVAEGVESQKQAEQLKQMGCDLGQGYYFAKPLPPEGVLEFLDR